MTLFDGIARGDVVAAAAIDSMSDDDFETALHRRLEIKQAVAATELHFLDSARRRGSHRRHGFRDTAAWVATLARERTGTVRRDVALAEQVAATPVVAEALSAGAVSKTQADVLVGGRDLPVEVQAELVERAEGLSVHQLGQAVREAQYDHGLVPTDPPAVPVARPDRQRRHSPSDRRRRGLRARQPGRARHGRPPRPPHGPPPGHRRAIALVGLARHYLEHTQTPSTDRVGTNHTLITLDLTTLLADRGGSALLSSGAAISGDTARRIACDAGITRILTKDPNEILDVGRATRTIPVALAKAVIARDRHCTHPDCHAPPWLCEIHHILHWALGGPTDLANLRLLLLVPPPTRTPTRPHRPPTTNRRGVTAVSSVPLAPGRVSPRGRTVGGRSSGPDAARLGTSSGPAIDRSEEADRGQDVSRGDAVGDRPALGDRGGRGPRPRAA